MLGRTYLFLGDNDAAIRWLLKSKEVNSSMRMKAELVYALVGAHDLRRPVAVNRFLECLDSAMSREAVGDRRVPITMLFQL